MRPNVEFYNTDDAARWGRSEIPDAWRTTRFWITEHDQNGFALELGCGMGALSGFVDQYAGLDLSVMALARVPHPFNRIAADMESLPLRRDSAAVVFSWAAIEHVPQPEKVLEEIARILRPRGLAVLAPAWHCRPWAAEGLEFREYHELSTTQRLRKALLPIRNALVLRAAREAPRRLWREVRALAGIPMPFEYDRLTPNLEAYVGTDSDAFTSMDPHAMILWFATRGWTIVSHPSRWDRLRSRHGAIVVRKP